jgi:GNAT superfamily N-acetyltransferase
MARHACTLPGSGRIVRRPLEPGQPSAIAIRAAHAADSVELTRIAHAAKRHWRYPEALIRLWKRDLTVSPRFLAGHPVYCAERDGVPVGFYALSRDDDVPELEHMWVAPEHIARGVGRALFAHLVARLRDAGATELRVASDPHAEGFYLRMGARRVGEVASRPPGRRLPLLVLRLEDEG